MKNPARFSKRDSNHDQVIKWFEQLYCTVVDTHTLGFGYPDLTIGISGETLLVEIKSVGGDLEESQKRFISEWRGGKIYIVRTHDDAIALVKLAQLKARLRSTI